MPPKLFVIGDIHGCAKELKSLLHKLPLDRDSVILFLGDYVDRGPDSKAVIDIILELSQIYKVITLKGNHEWLFTEYLANPKDPAASSNFILNGGSNTLASYSADGKTFKVPKAHRDFLAGLRLSASTETHFFVHAGVPPDFDFSSTEVDKKTAHQFMWIRSVFLESKKKWPKIVVHGHTPVETPEILPNRINLDTGCVFGRRLSAMNMQTGEIISVTHDDKVEPKFLVTEFSGGQTRAQRFSGDVLVEILYLGKVYPFRTVNFNEFGLLIYPAPESEQIKFKQGETVAGMIKPNAESIFDFTATVMRAETVNGRDSYGLKIERLRNRTEHA
jgi:serine/threonine protein phosphatase 1